MSNIKQYGSSFTFDGINSADYYVWVSGVGTYGAPERDMEFISIPGRLGDLIIDGKKFSNIDIPYSCFISSAFPSRYEAFRTQLLQRAGKYLALTDTYHPDEMRMAAYRGGLDPQMGINNRSGKFDVIFNCKPQRYLTSGLSLQPFTADGSITNPTPYEAKPFLRVYGAGTISVNGMSIEIAAHPFPYLDIDCEAMEAYYDDQSGNSYITLTDFPILSPGANAITKGATSRVDISPRWFLI